MKLTFAVLGGIAGLAGLVGGGLEHVTLLSPAIAQTGGATSCPATVATTEGPYYLDVNQVRSDITEDKEGVPLTLRIQVVDASTCAPLPGLSVDLWHADASGAYSGVSSNGPEVGGLPSDSSSDGEPASDPGAALRGTQVTDSQGFVEFKSIYPGWYPGRTTHIHYKVHLDESREFTSQIFFENSLSDQIYGMDPYSSHVGTRTLNEDDMVLASASDPFRTLFAQGAYSNGAVNANLKVGVIK